MKGNLQPKQKKSKTKFNLKKKGKLKPNSAKFQAKEPAFFVIKRAFLVVIAVGILLFNSFAKVDISAQNSNNAISISNLLQEHNNYRASFGLENLKLNALLNISAQKKAQVMIDNACWSHYCPPEKSPWDFFNETKYEYIYAGENLAEGFYKIDTLMQAWINSKTHRDNIVNPQFTEVGFAIVNANFLNNANNILIVVHFGSRIPTSMLPEENPTLNIVSPTNNSTINSSEVEIKGEVKGLSSIEIFNNNQLLGNASINNSEFSYKLNANLGANTIWASGKNYLTEIESNKVNLNYQVLSANEQTLNNSTSFIPVSDVQQAGISVDQKNTVNLVFAIALAIIFLIDLIIVSRTNSISSKRSFSHYHLSLVLMVAIIILIGGFAGQIQFGISI